MVKLEDLAVLLVEPSAIQRQIIEKALKQAGISHVYQAQQGQQALDELHTINPDLVVSSLYLPDMTGTDLIHHIRASATHGDTAFLLISSETRMRYLDPIRQAGAVGILPKPFSAKELDIALNSTLDLIDSSHLSLESQDGANLRALIVDDSALARKHIARVLAGMDIPLENIDMATDGSEALELINTRYYDFVISDYNMPNMDGKELIDHIRNDSNQSSIPVLMVTSESDQNRLAAVQQAGVSAICDKPFEPATVFKLIQRALND